MYSAPGLQNPNLPPGRGMERDASSMPMYPLPLMPGVQNPLSVAPQRESSFPIYSTIGRSTSVNVPVYSSSGSINLPVYSSAPGRSVTQRDLNIPSFTTSAARNTNRDLNIPVYSSPVITPASITTAVNIDRASNVSPMYSSPAISNHTPSPSTLNNAMPPNPHVEKENSVPNVVSSIPENIQENQNKLPSTDSVTENKNQQENSKDKGQNAETVNNATEGEENNEQESCQQEEEGRRRSDRLQQKMEKMVKHRTINDLVRLCYSLEEDLNEDLSVVIIVLEKKDDKDEYHYGGVGDLVEQLSERRPFTLPKEDVGRGKITKDEAFTKYATKKKKDDDDDDDDDDEDDDIPLSGMYSRYYGIVNIYSVNS